MRSNDGFKILVSSVFSYQHGTAIIVCAALLNAWVSGRKLSDVKLVFTGAGAAALATANMLVTLGENRRVYMFDIFGLIYQGREEDMFQKRKSLGQ